MPFAIPMPKSIGPLNYHFEQNASSVYILTVMLNKRDKDYDMIEELSNESALAKYTPEEICDGINELNDR